MYCAAKNQDYASVSLKDMEAMIRKAKDALYTFTSDVETRTTTVTNTDIDPNTGKVTVTETEVSEVWKIYTMVYNGEAQRVQQVLHLSEAEVMEITHFERGNGLISSNNNNITVEFKASPLDLHCIFRLSDKNNLTN